MDDMKQVKDEIEKQKERIEEDINAYFAFLEEDLRSKMTTIDIKAEQNHNNLEQFTRKNSVRLSGIKESDH